MNFDQAISLATSNGSVEVDEGVYFWTQSEIQMAQRGWADDDGSKGCDFSTAPYWITNDAGGAPSPVRDATDYELVLRPHHLPFHKRSM